MLNKEGHNSGKKNSSAVKSKVLGGIHGRKVSVAAVEVVARFVDLL